MSSKTAAEQQLEFLKKLKEQQKRAAPRQRSNSGEAGTAPEKPLSFELLKPKQDAPKSAKRRIPLSKSAWRLLKDQGIDKGKFKLNKALGDKAVELLLRFYEDQK